MALRRSRFDCRHNRHRKNTLNFIRQKYLVFTRLWNHYGNQSPLLEKEIERVEERMRQQIETERERKKKDMQRHRKRNRKEDTKKKIFYLIKNINRFRVLKKNIFFSK